MLLKNPPSSSTLPQLKLLLKHSPSSSTLPQLKMLLKHSPSGSALSQLKMLLKHSPSSSALPQLKCFLNTRQAAPRCHSHLPGAFLTSPRLSCLLGSAALSSSWNRPFSWFLQSAGKCSIFFFSFRKSIWHSWHVLLFLHHQSKISTKQI